VYRTGGVFFLSFAGRDQAEKESACPASEPKIIML
jgi:hypothetical protein